MEKHLILLDLDGTLLDDHKKIPEMNKVVVNELMNQGHEVIIVTGRAHYRSQMYYDELNLKGLLVNRNASHIHAPNDLEFIEHIDYIEDEVIQMIINHDFVQKMNKLYFENRNQIFVLKGDKDFYNQYQLCECIDLNDDFSSKINLVSFFVDQHLIDEIRDLLNTIEGIKYEQFGFREEAIFNLYPIHADKKNALNHLSLHYDVPIERMVALGDGLNDIEFIKNAGIGVVMKNGTDEVKRVAKMVTEFTNNEAGVGQFLANFFKLDI